MIFTLELAIVGIGAASITSSQWLIRKWPFLTL